MLVLTNKKGRHFREECLCFPKKAKKIEEVIHEILCINDIDTPSGAEYIVIVKLKVVFSKYERNSGQNSEQESKGG